MTFHRMIFKKLLMDSLQRVGSCTPKKTVRCEYWLFWLLSRSRGRRQRYLWSMHDQCCLHSEWWDRRQSASAAEHDDGCIQRNSILPVRYETSIQWCRRGVVHCSQLIIYSFPYGSLHIVSRMKWIVNRIEVRYYNIPYILCIMIFTTTYCRQYIDCVVYW